MTGTAAAGTERRRTGCTRRAVLAAPLALGLVALGGCSRGEDRNDLPGGAALIAWPAKGIWPEQLLTLPETTQQMYRDVAANRELLQYIPCYCGCYAYGHTCVFDCYVAEERPDGSILLDTMGFG